MTTGVRDMSTHVMQACPGDDTITMLVCGQLAGAQVAALESHVVDCPSCRKLVGILKSVPLGSIGGGDGGGTDKLRANMLALLAPNTTVGRYRIDSMLGAGGMGVVYAAHDPELDRRVALKLLYPTIGSSLADDREAIATALRHESKAMARLRHGNVATIYDLGSYRDQLFMVMELVEGTTLRAWVGANKPWETVVATFIEAGKGLAVAHEAGIVHCDFKPDNVLLDGSGRPVITDFGLAQVVAGTRSVPVARERAVAVGTSSILAIGGGQVFGTPAYMAPERFDATAPDVQSDVFGFTVSLYEVLYGRRPFDGTTVDQLCAAIATSPPVFESTTPAWLQHAIIRGLDPDRAVRFGSMTEMLDAMQPPVRRRRRWPLVAGAGVAVAGLAVAVAGATGSLRFDVALPSTSGSASAVTCDARGELAGIWDDGSRTRIGSAWTASGSDVSAHSWERVRRTLDRYADGWVRAADAVCSVPPASPTVADFQHRCLRSMRVQLRAVTERFAAMTDPKAIASADRTVAGLPSVDDCSSSAPPSPAPSDPAMRAEVERLRDELAAADGQSIAGKFDVATTAIDKLAASAKTVGFKPLIAEVQYARAMNLRGSAAKPEAIADALRDAAAQAQASGDEPLAVRAWNALAFQSAAAGGELARGREYVTYAKASLERLGGNPRLETQILTTLGRIDWQEGKLDDARRNYERAAELAKADPVWHVEALSGLAIVDTAAGRLAQALDENLEVLRLRRGMYGDDHPEIARSYTTLGDVTMRMARSAESLDYYRKADAAAQRALGKDHSTVQMTAHNLGGILRDLGRPAEAETEFRRAVRIATQALGPEHPYTAKSQQSLGMALFDQGKFADAVTELRHAVAVKQKAYGDDGFETVGAVNDLGIALRGAGKLDEALALTDKAIAGFAKLAPAGDDLAQAYVARARTLVAMHRNRDAGAALDKAMSIYAHTEAPAELLDEVRALQAQVKASR